MPLELNGIGKHLRGVVATLHRSFFRKATFKMHGSKSAPPTPAAALLILLLATVTLPASARPATHRELVAFSRESANDSRLGSVDIGSGFVESDSAWSWAIATWRSGDGRRHGQALFFYMCDHWNLTEVTTGVFTKSQLLRVSYEMASMTVSPKLAPKLAADSIELQHTRTAYLPPSRPTATC